MYDIILLLFFNSLLIWGFYFACQFNGWESFDALDSRQKKAFPEPSGKMIFWWVRYRWNLGEFLAKPVYLCTLCMSSVHGVIPYFYYYGIDGIFKFPFYVLALAGLNAVMMYKVFSDVDVEELTRVMKELIKELKK